MNLRLIIRNDQRIPLQPRTEQGRGTGNDRDGGGTLVRFHV